MKKIEKLTWKQLESAYPPSDFSFKTTDDLQSLDEVIGQERAKKAMEFGLLVEADGYNIYMSGKPGTGKTSMAKRYTQEVASKKKTPRDWCYVYNFKEKRVPKALGFEPGDGRRFKNDMNELIAYLTKEIPYIYASQEHEKLKINILNKGDKDSRQEIEDIEYQMGLTSVGYYIKILKERYSGCEKTLEYLDDVQYDILSNIEVFIKQEEQEALINLFPWAMESSIKKLVSKYEVNLLVDHSECLGAPVITSSHLTTNKLFGEIEYDHGLGGLSTNYMKIRPGLLHEANGGYLILQAEDLLTNPDLWTAMKQVLKSKKLEFENPLLKLEAIPMDLKLILIGSQEIYHLLYEKDPDFKRFFKVRADFDDEMCNNQENNKLIARFIARISKEQSLCSFSPKAVKCIIRYARRQVGNQKKITADFDWIRDMLIEANTYAKMQGAQVVQEKHVHLASQEKRYRASLYEEKMEERILNSTKMISTSGSRIGEINALAVHKREDHSFGHPMKITATSYKGRSGVINIEKEAKLSGPIHTKGTQVIAGYLGHTYAKELALSITCRICYEQSYGKIDGDSASSAELYSVISSLSGIPIKQNIAVTGSTNQHGKIQAVGSITHKVEGFYKICQKRGLSGDQGVIIPKQNIEDLVLNNEVIEAVKNGQFHIYPISDVEEGLEILMARPYREIKDKVRATLKLN